MLSVELTVLCIRVKGCDLLKSKRHYHCKITVASATLPRCLLLVHSFTLSFFNAKTHILKGTHCDVAAAFFTA